MSHEKERRIILGITACIVVSAFAIFFLWHWYLSSNDWQLAYDNNGLPSERHSEKAVVRGVSFDVRDAVQGAKIGSMTVVGTETFSEALPRSQDNVVIRFEGTARIVGRYVINKEEGSVRIYDLDIESLTQLPNPKDSSAPIWFELRDGNKVRSSFGTEPNERGGVVSLDIDSYRIGISPGDMRASANLVRVVNKRADIADIKY